MATTSAKRQSNRWPALLDAAASQFAERGYHATSMRDLAAASAMTAGAIYFHVASKQALLLAVYGEGVQRILDRVEAAVAAEQEPWTRLENAVTAHLEAILDTSAYARVIIRILPGDAPEISAELKELRDRYESRFARYFSAIPLPRERDATIARLLLLGALNWTPVWYRDGGKSVPAIVRELLAPLRALAGVKPVQRRK
ncbi:MAG TPA: TetR family transcriptional regulator [Xanthobacteraceae bacterium]|nr:TetR family transcriptional regulator [Xanthobacteraceae bacterium]